MFETNNERGRAYALIIGIYFVVKAILNMILGGSTTDIVCATFETIVLFIGFQYINYVIAGITAITFLYYLKGNLSAPLDNIIYLIEGGIDVLCVIILVCNANVKEHFTNKWIKKK